MYSWRILLRTVPTTRNNRRFRRRLEARRAASTTWNNRRLRRRLEARRARESVSGVIVNSRDVSNILS